MAGAFGAVSGERPKASGIRVTTSAFGQSIPLVYGRNRVATSVIWAGSRTQMSDEIRAGSGEFGLYRVYDASFIQMELRNKYVTNPPNGGFGAGITSTNFEYFISLILGICEGRIINVSTVFKDKDRRAVARTYETDGGVMTVDESSDGFPGTQFFLGKGDQPVWDDGHSIKFTDDGIIFEGLFPSESLNYPHTAYMARHFWPLRSSAAVPQISLDVTGLQSSGDFSVELSANIADVIRDMLTHPIHGAGFPAGRLAGLDDFRRYCAAERLYISPVIETETEAADLLSEYLQLGNADAVWTGGVLRIVPLADDRVGSYTPSFVTVDEYSGERLITPAATVGPEDFIVESGESGEGDPPLKFTRGSASDVTNSVSVKFVDSGAQFAPAEVSAKDEASIETHGIRSETIETDALTVPEIALKSASLYKQRRSAIRDIWEFRLPWKFARLDPLDIISITHPALGVDNRLVQIQDIEEEDDGILRIRAEDYLTGLGTSKNYTPQLATPDLPDLNADPGRVTYPTVFEPTAAMTGNKLQIWMGVRGRSPLWGGCQIYITDEAEGFEDFTWVGTLDRSARIGQLYGTYPVGGTLVTKPNRQELLFDDANVMGLRMFTAGRPEPALESASDELASLFTLPVYVGGGCDSCFNYEIVSWKTADLTGVASAWNQYLITEVYRAGFDSLPQEHIKGGRVMVLDDDRVLKLTLPDRFVGKRVRIRFLSFNLYGGSPQTLETALEVAYHVRGEAFSAPLDTINNLAFTFSGVGNSVRLSWDRVTDGRPIQYELRKGYTFETAVPLQVTEGGTGTRQATAEVGSDGTYWVAARTGYDRDRVRPLVYGPASAVTVFGLADLRPNIVREYDEIPAFFGHDYQRLVENYQPGGPLYFWRCGSYVQDIASGWWDSIVGESVIGSVFSPTGVTYQAPGAITSDTDAAISLDGATGYLSTLLQSSSKLNFSATDDWSLLAWVKTTHGAEQTIFARSHASATSGKLGINSSGLLFWEAGTGAPRLTASTVPLNDGNWHQVVISFRADRQIVTLFADQHQLAQAEGQAPLNPGYVGTLYVGVQAQSPFRYWNGSLDEIVFWNRQQHRAKVVGYWKAGSEYDAGVFESFVKRSVGVQRYFRLNQRQSSTTVDEISNAIADVSGVTVVPGILPGDSDTALRFDGATSTFNSRGTLGADEDALSLECVVQANGPAFLLGLVSGPTIVAALQLDTFNRLSASVRNTTGASFLVISSQNLFTYGEENHHVVLTFSRNAKLKLYLDGVLVGQAITTDFPVDSAGAVVRAGHHPGLPTLEGVLDEVVVYNLDLSGGSEEVSPPGILARADSALSGHLLTGLVADDDGNVYAEEGQSGYFQVPDNHIISVSDNTKWINVSVDYDVEAHGTQTWDEVDQTDDISLVDISTTKGSPSAASSAAMIEGYPEIQLSDEREGDSWRAWQKLEPGLYRGFRFRTRFFLKSARGVIAVLKDFRWRVDVPDMTLRGSFQSSAGSNTVVTFPRAFETSPEVAFTIFSAEPGDYVEIIYVTTTLAVVNVRNVSGLRVSRSCCYLAQGY